ncbi:MAG: site-2 protease family protein [Minisyncoccia bacterium]
MIGFILALISLSITLVIHELGHFLLALKNKVRVDEFGIGYPPRLIEIKKQGIIYSFNAIPFGALTSIYEGDKKNPEKNSFYAQPFAKKFVILFAGPLFNFLTAYLIFTLLFSLGMPQNLIPESFNLSPYKVPLYLAPLKSLEFIWVLVKETIVGLGRLLVNLILRMDVKELVGPVGIMAITTKGFNINFIYGLYILGLISFGFAFFNLLPIPALDGGRIFFLLIEKIRKKEINQATENFINNLVFALLLILMVFVTIKDIKIFIFKS